MISNRSNFRPVLALIISAAFLSAVATPASAKSTASIERTEDNLAAAGFIVKPANTPERAAMLVRLPANKFVQRVSGDDVTYVYADPKACGCLYVGTQEAYGQYQKAMQAKNLLDQQADNAQLYSDNAWNWGAWGPWGPHWGFGFRGW
jgi:hypothetical protein